MKFKHWIPNININIIADNKATFGLSASKFKLAKGWKITSPVSDGQSFEYLIIEFLVTGILLEVEFSVTVLDLFK